MSRTKEEIKEIRDYEFKEWLEYAPNEAADIAEEKRLEARDVRIGWTVVAISAIVIVAAVIAL